MEYEILEKFPSPEEYNLLRKLVGWGQRDQKVIEHSLCRSLYCICAYIDQTMVGMARVIGDDGLVYYIQDVIVRPDYQRLGIGTQLMDKIMAYIRAHASPGAVIGLMSAHAKEPFYEKYGFVRRPTAQLGHGMTIFWRTEPTVETC